MNLGQATAQHYRQSVNSICLILISVLALLAVGFQERVSGWQQMASDLIVTATVFAGVQLVVGRLQNDGAAAALHCASVLLLFDRIFQAIAGLQHVFVSGWKDALLLTLEENLFGINSSVLLQQVIHPLLTEAMMFSYVMYIPLLPVIGMICYWSGASKATADYLLNLSLAYVGCYLGFILFPVASPLYHSPELYSVPLTGGFFTWCGEWIRSNMHYPGGSLPSPHCAATTVMAAMLFRYRKTIFFVALPTLLLVYVATVYGRYHYAWDSIAGVLTGLSVLRLSPAIVAATGSWFSPNRPRHVSSPASLEGNY